MENREYLINLYEEYKSLLTEKQRLYFENYYFEDLSFSEIADNNDVSKSLVGKVVKTVENKLKYYENILNIYSKNKIINEVMSEMNNEKLKSKLESIL